MLYKEALKECKKVGCAHAKGDAYRAMLASVIWFAVCFQKKTAPRFYAYFQTFKTDEEARQEWNRLHREPLSAFDIPGILGG